MLNITSAGGTEFLEQELQMLLESLPSDKNPVKQQEIICEKKNEGFLDASKVQYVSRAGNFVEKGYSYTGTLRILKVIMGYDYLWINIRVKGGAYGCMSGFGKNGDTYFASYRDPKLRATNEIYEKIPEYLKEFDADERDMTKYIIGTISEMDTPLTPISRGRRSPIRYLGHITDEELQKRKRCSIKLHGRGHPCVGTFSTGGLRRAGSLRDRKRRNIKSRKRDVYGTEKSVLGMYERKNQRRRNEQ